MCHRGNLGNSGRNKLRSKAEKFGSSCLGSGFTNWALDYRIVSVFVVDCVGDAHF